MNKWTKTILIAVGVTLLFIVIAYIIKSRSTPATYRGHYEVKISPKKNALPGNVSVMNRVTDILKTRITNARSAVELKAVNNQLIDLKISKIKDTGQMARLLTGNSRMEFREMYTLKELGGILAKADTLLGYKTKREVKKIVIEPLPKDSSLVKFSETAPPPPEVQEKSLWLMLQPAQVYTEPSGVIRYPSQIAYVLVKDTAIVAAELQRKELLNSLPIDVKFEYGIREKKTEYIPLYAVRINPDKPALLSNDDIMTAKAGYSNTGEPEILFEFNPGAAKKWAGMTAENVGKPIGIIIDNRVISAPNVNSPIYEGVANISGGFTFSEAQDLAIQLGTRSLPAGVTILKQEITKEGRPFLPGNPLKYLLVFVVAGGLSYLILSLLTNN